ncbi:MAG: FAD-dependent oxidoreductase [Cyanobacteriota bacterium]|nr:FAD-dependent oxidoreductase [Cyanobacteriota bacterium]
MTQQVGLGGWRLSGLRLPLDHGPDALEAAIVRRLRLEPGQLRHWNLVKRSVDARRKDGIRLVYSVDLEVEVPPPVQQRLRRRWQADAQLQPRPDSTYQLPHVSAAAAGALRPVVVGAGPCGYFAALLLAQMGLRPLLLERGKAVKQRSADTFGFWRGQRPFDPESNAQFGEGGAGTFSDGKLYSQVSEPLPYQRKVLEELVAAGANPDILTLHHPHIGTFKLATVVRGLRQRIADLGGSVRFESRVERLLLDPRDRRVQGVVLADGETIAASQVVLAPGHSARDLFATLQQQGVELVAKPFAMGVRIEHPQALIDRARWGAAAGHPRLGAAEYKLVHHCSGEGLEGRSVWSFCMCPGGLVVGATSEEGMVVTNGMSQHSRNERNANSGLVVNITLDDLAPYGSGPGDPLAGVAFQRHWEAKAYALGGCSYAAPSQRVGAFLGGSDPVTAAVLPSYQPAVRDCDISQCLPGFVSAALRQALPVFAQRIPGYADADALMTAVETRTSSPVRLPRGSTSLESCNTPGLYPAGEGAGYAGGILSAAIDGIKVAEQVALALERGLG